MSVEDVMEQVNSLSQDDQAQLAAELARKVLKRKLSEIGSLPDTPLPLTDVEIDQIVHEARRETLRARGI